jgi:hypothetical protein
MMRSARSDEKRRRPRETVRLSGTGVIITKGPGGDAGRLRGGESRFPVATADVSASGLQMHFNADLVARDTVRLSFLGGVSDEPIEVEGHLVWVRRNAVDIFGRYTAGVCFSKPDESLPARFAASGNKTE